ncbi:MAG TPA: hypothetical protein VFV54_04985, partial [Thermoanaerobaculia bacterium]|nr:hypothetical protein [Thermoanaerobaculia bacterium]
MRSEITSLSSFRVSLVVAALLFAGCRTTPPAPPPPLATSVTESAPSLRLDDRAAPLSYELDLAIDPAVPTFDGRIGIEIDVRHATRVLWLNARDLEVTGARLEGPKPREATILPGGREFVGLEFAEPLAPGRAILR